MGRSGTFVRNRAATLAAALALLTGSGLTVSSQPMPRPPSNVYPDFSTTADTLLRTAAGHAKAGQWAEAVDLYQRVIGQFGETVAPLPREDDAPALAGVSKLYVNVRQYCQRRLAAMPPEALALYRLRVDSQAERWYRQGRDDRDGAALRRLVEEAFCSSWGDDALELLGDFAFQDGRFAEAIAYYRRLVPEKAGADILGLAHPDPDIDRARVAAKALLARALLGESPPTPEDLAALARDYPGAEGSLAGRTGPYVEIVTKALAEDRLTAPSALDSRWPTFAGAFSRNRRLPDDMDVGSPQWTVKLDPIAAHRGGLVGLTARFGGNAGNAGAASGVETIAAYHPIVVGDQVIVATDRNVRAYDLDERPRGADDVLWQYPPQGQGLTRPATIPQGSARFSLTASGDKIFARLGPSGWSSGGARGTTELVALDRTKEGKFLWKVQANEVELPNRKANPQNRMAIAFEGAPVADGRHVFIALSESAPQVNTWVACLDAETGRTRWIRYVCAASQLGAENAFNGGMGGFAMPIVQSVDAGQRMLSLDGATLYYQTNLGAVAALDVETGLIRWFATYPRADRLADRDLNPAIVHDGLVYVAPGDSPGIFAFEAATGRLAWRADAPPKLAHLLGVAHGRLIATGDHVWSLDARDGRMLRSWPDSLNGYDGFGRGLLAGETILWPTKAEIQVIDQATGTRAADRPPIPLGSRYGQGGGNLIAGDGYLIVAGADALAVYSQNSRLIRRYREEIARDPGRAVPYFQLAQVAEATGDEPTALEALEAAERKAGPAETVDGRPLAEAARSRRFGLLMRMGGRAIAGGDAAGAAGRFELAGSLGAPGRDRLTARLRLAEALRLAGRPDEAVGALQALLIGDEARTIVVPVDEHRSLRADLRIADQLAAILREHGRAPYAEFDERARALLGRAIDTADAGGIAEVGRLYPVADCMAESLAALGRVRLDQGRPAEAAEAYRRLLAEAPEGMNRARTLLGLARAYEAQGLWIPARRAYVQVRDRHPSSASATDARDALGRPPLDRLEDDDEVTLRLPLRRVWERRWEGASRLIAPEGTPPTAESPRLYLARGTQLRPIVSPTGESPWTAELQGEPLWVAYLGDRLIAATAERIVGLSIATGTPLWTFGLDAEGPAKPAGPDPFAKGPPEADLAAGPAVALSDFRLVGDRLYCRRGDREVLAIEAGRGLLAWSYTPGVGRIHEQWAVGPRRVVFQVRQPHALCVLDAADGRRIAEYPQDDAAVAWPRPPLLLDDDRMVVVSADQTIALIDLRLGTEAWRRVEQDPLPRDGVPVLLGDAGALLALVGGTELIRLDPKTGARLWARPLGAEVLSRRPEALAVDGDRAYFLNGPRLGAIDLDSGRVVWSRPLTGPNTGWSLVLCRDRVIAHAGPIRAGEADTGRLPVVVCRRSDGVRLQRLLLPPAADDLAVRTLPGGALVASPTGAWSLGDRPMVDGGPVPR